MTLFLRSCHRPDYDKCVISRVFESKQPFTLIVMIHLTVYDDKCAMVDLDLWQLSASGLCVGHVTSSTSQIRFCQ